MGRIHRNTGLLEKAQTVVVAISRQWPDGGARGRAPTFSRQKLALEKMVTA